MREREDLRHKRCEVCHRLRHRDDIMLLRLSKTRLVESPVRSMWICFFCIEDLRRANAFDNTAFKAWRRRAA